MALKKSEESSLSPELMSQFQSNFATQTKEPAPLTEKKKPDYKNIFNVHMGTGDKARLKIFCAEHEVPINTFILYAIDRLLCDVEEGRCTVSKSGVRTIRREGH